MNQSLTLAFLVAAGIGLVVQNTLMVRITQSSSTILIAMSVPARWLPSTPPTTRIAGMEVASPDPNRIIHRSNPPWLRPADVKLASPPELRTAFCNRSLRWAWFA